MLPANVRPCERDATVPLITDQVTARVTDLFNVAYEILLQIFERFFAHTEETEIQLGVLADATVGLMLRVVKPLGDLITTLPAGPDYPGMTAGPSFELFYETDYLMPHRKAAWALLTERLDTAASFCAAILAEGRSDLADRLEPVLAALGEIAQALAVHLPASHPHAKRALAPAPAAPGELGALLQRADDLSITVAAANREGEVARGLAEVFDAVYSVVTASGSRSGSNDISPNGAVARLVASVLRPLADALGRYAADGPTDTGQPAAAPARRVVTGTAGEAASETAASETAVWEAAVWEAAQAATRLRVRLAETGAAPPELAEAAAALQDLACALARPGEKAKRLAALWHLQDGLPAMITTASNGPYLVTNARSLLSHLGEPIQATPQMALCRCGESSLKPFCDGTHASIGFSDAKDPKRVPDRRDTYRGQQVTILDNRGICQHSGYCTDRLAAVFRAGQEPFVAPSGGPMDEIIRVVRDCPSGALSFQLADREAREQVDWAGRRQAAIEVTRDGPYRITGGIRLVDASGADVARGEGASLEHYALCRCGHSQNKPFCSGMHTYVEFRDPVAVAGREPTLFEWAGGLPALTRMTHLLYEKHVPADPLLAPVFANMSADHPRREALWLAEVFGGPAHYSQEHGGYQQMTARHAGRSFTEEQRARWVALVSKAAQEAGLPTDPEFGAAFSAYIEWGSRVAAGESALSGEPSVSGEPGVPGGSGVPGASGGPGGPGGSRASRSPNPPMPRWDWSPAGPPDTRAAAEDAQRDRAEEPAVTLPAAGETVSFGNHIRPLFRHRDRQSMMFAFDLWSHDDVRAHASDILKCLRNGSMPCDGAWTEDQVQIFERWAESGMAR